jgi:hypothetical protein
LTGRTIYGTIEEFEPDDFVSIRTENGKIYEYSMDDVRRVQRGSIPKGSSSRSSARNSHQNVEYEDNDSYGSRQNRRYGEDVSYSDGSGSISGYKGTFDVGYTLPMSVGETGRIEAHTSHGYQLNDYLFAGVGAGLHIYSARDMNLKYAKIGGTDNYPHYIAESTSESGVIKPDASRTWMHGVDSSFMTVPIFLDIRGYYPMNKIVPFAMFRVGYSFNLADGFGEMGLYMNPAIGVKYNLSQKLGITFSLGYSVQNYGGLPKNGGYGFYYFKDNTKTGSGYFTPYEAKNAGGLTLKLGVEF